MSKITDSAMGKDCLVRLPGCSHNPEETVHAHLRMAGTGIGKKEIDILGARACMNCHNVVDGRSRPPEGWELRDVEIAFHEGIFRTQRQLIEEGIIKIGGKNGK